MGAYDEQTISGAINTGTHGTGLEFSTLADIVKSMDMVLPGGRKVRLEPRNGLTDPEAFRAKHPNMELIQDDELFHASTIGLGNMGVVHSYVLDVEPKYHLEEKRTVSTWEDVSKKMLRNEGAYNLMTGDGRKEVKGKRYPARHFGVLINPYDTGRKDEHTALITTRKRVDEPRKKRFKPGKNKLAYKMLHPNFSRPWKPQALLRAAPKTIPKAFDFISEKAPGMVPGLIKTTLKSGKDKRYIERSYNVHLAGDIHSVAAYSAEIALPIKDDKYIDAVNALLERINEHKEQGKMHTTPLSLRFVKKSNALMAPQQEDCVMVDIIFMANSKDAKELLKDYEDLLKPFGGRPHFGKYNHLTNEKVKDMYGDNFDRWSDARSVLDPSGVMRNPTSDTILAAPE
jgi:FAD/FMN-containing dehydrogenase